MPADVMACADALQRLAQEAQGTDTPVQRVAVVGDLTSDLLARAVACAIAQEDELPLLYAAPYGVMQQVCLDPGSALHAFRPDLVCWYLTGGRPWQHCRSTPPLSRLTLKSMPRCAVSKRYGTPWRYGAIPSSSTPWSLPRSNRGARPSAGLRRA